ncbi:hypothetical protein LVJ94_39750 [Pendulispora rubella]|uniref:Phosphatidylglycerol/phosphatidylinositol transfer protein n=1 Tax=Pendulispora rubella TaxID=2741070 RepID=A0ABZ2L1C4_9BACT
MNTRGRCELVLLASVVIGIATSLGSAACYHGIGGSSCDSYEEADGKRDSRQSVDGTFVRTFDDGTRRDFLDGIVQLRRQDIRTPSAIWLSAPIARPDAGAPPWDGGADPHRPTIGITTVMRLRRTRNACSGDTCPIEIDVLTCPSPRQWMKEAPSSPDHDVAPTCWDTSGATSAPRSWTTSGTMHSAKPRERRETGSFNVSTAVTVDIPKEGNAKLYGHATITVQDSRECM